MQITPSGMGSGERHILKSYTDAFELVAFTSGPHDLHGPPKMKMFPFPFVFMLHFLDPLNILHHGQMTEENSFKNKP